MTLVSHHLPLNTMIIPAPTTLAARALVTIAVKVETWSMRRRTRQHLRDLPEHILFDIGLTREQATLEASKYFWRA